jgi:hypothetical protein
MNSYQPSTPRAALGSIAVVMAAITIGAMVVLPATLDALSPARFALVQAATATSAPIEVAISPARIDVIAVREPNVAWALTDAARPNCKPEG